jgi:hypothetical protein
MHRPKRQIRIDSDSRPASGREPKASRMISRSTSVSLLLYAVLLAIWAAPFVRLGGHAHSLYGLFGVSEWRALPVSFLFTSLLVTVLMLPRKGWTTYGAAAFLAWAVGQMRTFLPFEESARPLPLVGYWLSLAVMVMMTARVLLMIEAHVVEASSWSWVGGARTVKPRRDDAPSGSSSMEGSWRRLLVTLPLSLVLLYGVPILFGLFSATEMLAYLGPWAGVCPWLLTLVLLLAGVRIRRTGRAC